MEKFFPASNAESVHFVSASHVCLVSINHLAEMKHEEPTFCPRSKVASHRDSIRNGKIPHINNNTPTLINYADSRLKASLSKQENSNIQYIQESILVG